MIDSEKVLDVIEDLECELSFCKAVECNTSTLFVSDLEDYLNVINGQKAEIESLIAGQETLQTFISEKDKEIERLQKENIELDGANILLTVTLQNAKSEAVKEYKSKVENDIVTLLGKLNCTEFINCLEYRYKEMVGDAE